VGTYVHRANITAPTTHDRPPSNPFTAASRTATQWISRGDRCHDSNCGGFSVLLTVSFRNTFALLPVVFHWSACCLGGRKKEEALDETIQNVYRNDDDPTMVDDRGRRRSVPRLDHPVPRHDDASCCRTKTTSTFLPCRHRQTTGGKMKRHHMRLISYLLFNQCTIDFPPTLYNRDGILLPTPHHPARPRAIMPSDPDRATRSPKERCGGLILKKNYSRWRRC
jgi:hypothetical protein